MDDNLFLKKIIPPHILRAVVNVGDKGQSSSFQERVSHTYTLKLG